MTVYVLSRGTYEPAIVGVFSSAEKAMQSLPLPRARNQRDVRWLRSGGDGSWQTSGTYSGDALIVEPYEVDG